MGNKKSWTTPTPHGAEEVSKVRLMSSGPNYRGFYVEDDNFGAYTLENTPTYNRTIVVLPGVQRDTLINWNEANPNYNPNKSALASYDYNTNMTPYQRQLWKNINKSMDNSKKLAKPLAEPIDYPNLLYNTGAYKCGGEIVKGEDGILVEIPEENRMYREKRTELVYPSVGQTSFGAPDRPKITQIVKYNPLSAENDTTYKIKGVIPNINPVGGTAIIQTNSISPKSDSYKKILKNLANTIDYNYDDWNGLYGSYPYGYYNKTVTVKKR